MSASSVRAKVSALMWLAGGKSARVAAEAAGVAAGTVAAWRRDPVFAAELEAVAALYGKKPLDAAALMSRLVEAEKRLAPAASSGGGVRRVRVRVPAGASPEVVRERARRAVGRAITRDVKARSAAVEAELRGEPL
ncbi:hypothetical protein OG426_19465 [Streptomyces canus]|uniref:hypothetical protein n=1 Tax=Streptomyces canus TaxID=58343 RepID=UPI003869683C|nr:hypothetical protein OG426_19465 [Streptomyces canus]